MSKRVIETWGFYLFPSRTNEAGESTTSEYQSTYDEYMDLWVKSEEWGLDGLFFAEHHFHRISLSPSPNLLIAAIAARTQRLRFAVAGTQLAINDARRVVEEYGMLDYITNGRFEPGIAPGAGDLEATLAGLPSELIRPRYYSGADIVEQALTGPNVTKHDDFYNLDDLHIVPNIRQHPGRSAWVTVLSPGSATWTGERGLKMITSWVPTPVAVAMADAYRAAADAAGHSTAPSNLGLRRRVYVADSDAEAQDTFEETINTLSGGKGYEMADPKTAEFMMQRDDIIIGSPETVADALIEQCQAGGYGVVAALVDTSAFSPSQMTRCHELLGTRVAPLLRSASVGAPPSNSANLASVR